MDAGKNNLSANSGMIFIRVFYPDTESYIFSDSVLFKVFYYLKQFDEENVLLSGKHI